MVNCVCVNVANRKEWTCAETLVFLSYLMSNGKNVFGHSIKWVVLSMYVDVFIVCVVWCVRLLSWSFMNTIFALSSHGILFFLSMFPKYLWNFYLHCHSTSLSIFMNVPLSPHEAITHIFHLTKLSTHTIFMVLEIWLVSRYNSHYDGQTKWTNTLR